uniref:Uncharacterized protein n=1 Tax=Ralstonia solanacearum TaxID=305 RepID=A0A0S4UGW0_RALSL|nr:protein of unknown function [Ralstonia solanacearum]
MWRHGCRHRAPRDGFTACPASGEGTAHSTHSAYHPLMRQSSQVSHAARYALASDIKKAGLRPPF